MISPVHKYIESYANAGADIITIHPEATNDLLGSINKIKEFKKKVGISLNPETKIEIIKEHFRSNRFNLSNERKSRFWRTKIYA